MKLIGEATLYKRYAEDILAIRNSQFDVALLDRSYSIQNYILLSRVAFLSYHAKVNHHNFHAQTEKSSGRYYVAQLIVIAKGEPMISDNFEHRVGNYDTHSTSFTYVHARVHEYRGGGIRGMYLRVVGHLLKLSQAFSVSFSGEHKK